MCKPPGTLHLKKFGPGKLWVENVPAQNICIDKLLFFRPPPPPHPDPKWTNNLGPISSTFHVERPETLTEWKFENVTELRTYGRSDMGRDARVFKNKLIVFSVFSHILQSLSSSVLLFITLLHYLSVFSLS